MDCPFGGICIDPGRPSDCAVNGGCICFNSAAEKTAFDCLPKLYKVKGRSGEMLLFTTDTQADFYITDFGGEQVP